MSWLTKGMSFLPGLGGLWIYLAVAVVSAGLASVGTYKVEHWRSLAAVAGVQKSFDEYRHTVDQSTILANQHTLDALSSLNKSLSGIQRHLTEVQVQHQKASSLLIERLQHENGKSCPLSPAVVEYLDSLRGTHTSGN